MKKSIIALLIFLILLFNFSFVVKSDSAGPNSPGNVVDDSSVGDCAWNDPTYAKASDNKYATVSPTMISGYSHYLKATNFGFSIPSGATINGIKVEIERHANDNSGTRWVKDWKVYLLKNGNVVGDNKADTSTNWPTSDAYKSYGGSSDLWGTSWTASDINNANFGVVLAVQMSAGIIPPPTAYVDHIRITVYYTPGENNPPEISNEYPLNGSTGIDLQPTCHVYVTDADGDSMTVKFYENTTGSWVLRQTNSSVSSGSTVYWTYEQANEYNTTYYWKVEVTDGTDTTTTIYHFTTLDTELHLFYLRELDPTHGQPTSSGWDIGSLLSSPPSSLEYRKCGSWVGFFYDDESYEFTTVSKLYIRVWWMVEKKFAHQSGYWNDSEVSYDAISNPKTFWMNRTSDIIENVYDKYLSVNTYFNLNVVPKENQYNFSVRFRTYSNSLNIWAFSSPEYQSFVIINFPDNDTLQSTDSDGDGISDYDEMFVNYTNPLDTDTDDDGYTDDVDAYPNDKRLHSEIDYGNYSLEVESTSSDGYMYKSSTSWETVRNGTSYDDKDCTSTTFKVGDENNKGTYTIWRAVLYFNTTDIPDNAIIKTVTLKLYGADTPGDDFYHTFLRIVNGQPVYPHDPLQPNDYDITHYSGNGSWWHTGQFNLNTYNEIEFTNVTWINKTGITKFVIISKNDYQNNPPDSGQYHWVVFSSSEATNHPILNITYDIPPNNPPTITNPYPENDTTDVEIKPICHIDVSDPDGDTMTIYWYENSTGSWVLRQTNSSVPNGTYYWTFEQATSYNTTYWWKVVVNDSTDETVAIYHFTTGEEPSITINYVGNESNLGGPYYIPGLENTSEDGPYCPDGYFTDGSKQVEDWLYINCTIENSDSISSVYLCLYNVTTDIWNNDTTLINTGGDYWEVNTSGNITITAGHLYSFNIKAVDKNGDSFIVYWNKSHNDTVKYRRRYVYLGCDAIEFSYLLLNLSDYPVYPPDGMNVKSFKPFDNAYHDHSAKGETTATTNDQGQMTSKSLTDYVNDNYCSIWAGFWFNETLCIEKTQLTNIYIHVWASALGNGKVNISIKKERAKNTYVGALDWKIYSPSDAKSTIHYTPAGNYGNDTFKLYADKIVLDNPLDVDDNSIYELLFIVKDVPPESDYPHVISNISFPSFVIFNVPDNDTLNNTYGDSDGDGLTDWQELYVTYTNPFIVDTDHDGISDYNEYQSGTDPNNYTDFNHPPQLTNPSASPSSGVADYTIFYFNITYSDPDGDPPAEIKVNISKTGWYINVSMTYISGDNTTGALYSYNTTLSTGVYDYLFYASDGEASTVNDPTDQVNVEAQSYSFTVSTADPSGQENFTASATMGAEWNVSASYQTSSIPAIQITNTGNVPINISINLTSTPISNVHIKYNTSSTPPSFTTDPYSCDNELTTTPTQVGSYIQPGDTLNIWLWADFENKYNPGEYFVDLWIESSGAT